MADDEQFSLCWNNFNTNLSAGFHDSLCRGDLVDVTLAAEGQFVKAHRLVLSVCSPYFRKMFTQMPANQHAIVFLKDVSHSALKDLIQFMYCGEVNVKQDALPAFISTAEALQIKGLTDGEPAPSQSPAKPSTPAPQPTIPAASMTAPAPRVRTQRSTARTYKLESEDSGDDKPQQIVIQTQQQQIVQGTQKRPAQRSITPHSVPSIKRVKNSDPLEAAEPTQITVQTVTDSKSNSGGEAEFIDLPMDLPTKSEPDYAEDAGDVDAAEQETTYVEDDSYGDMKYDESYFTENDESAAATTTATTSGAVAIKAQSGSFSESYVSDTGDQSATEAQDVISNATTAQDTKDEAYMPVIVEISKQKSKTYDGVDQEPGKNPPRSTEKRFKRVSIEEESLGKNEESSVDVTVVTEQQEKLSLKKQVETNQALSNDAIPLHLGSTIYVSKQDLFQIFTPNPKIYISRLTDLLFKDVEQTITDGQPTVKLDPERAKAIITHVVQVFARRGEPISEEYVRKFLKLKLYRMTTALQKKLSSNL